MVKDIVMHAIDNTAREINTVIDRQLGCYQSMMSNQKKIVDYRRRNNLPYEEEEESMVEYEKAIRALNTLRHMVGTIFESTDFTK